MDKPILGTEPRSTNSFSAIVSNMLYTMPVPAFTGDADEYQDMKAMLGCNNEGQYVTQKQLVMFALFIQKCFEAQSVHMDAGLSHTCNHFTKLLPERDSQLLAMDNEYPYKDDQYVSPKVIEEYTGYSDTTVRNKLSAAVIKGQIECHRDLILDANGKEQLNKKGEVRASNPRYRWGDVKLVFGARRKELLSVREQKRRQNAQELQRKHIA